jgi:nitrous oxidase accessory protein NosD
MLGSRDLKFIQVFVVLVLIGMMAALGPADRVYADTISVGPGDSIQDAIDAANPGDTISVAAGTYAESISINKSVILQSTDGAASTVIAPISGPAILLRADDVTIDGFTLTSSNSWGLDLDGGSGTPLPVGGVDNTLVQNCIFSSSYHEGLYIGYGASVSDFTVSACTFDSNRNGIGVSGSATMVDGLTIKDSVLSGNKDHGLYLKDATLNDLLIQDTDFTDNEDEGVHLDGASVAPFTIEGGTIESNAMGMVIKGGATLGALTFDDITVQNNAESGVILGWGSSATALTVRNSLFQGNAWEEMDISGGWFGAFSVSGETSIIHNVFGGGPWAAIYIGDQASFGATPVIHNNDLSGYGFAVLNASSTLVNASGNWWGSSAAATVRARANGGTNVDYSPWLDSGIDTNTDPGFQGDFSILYVDDDSSQSGLTGRIQEGINMVSGSTVYVAAGTYNERVTINKSLSLLGAQHGVDPTAAGARANPANESIITEAGLVTPNPDILIEIPSGVSDVIVDGFTLQGDLVNATADTSIIRCWDDRITIDNNIMEGRLGVLYKGADGLTVNQNRMLVNKNGVIVQPNPASDVIISNNTFSLGSDPAGDASAIYMASCSQCRVTENTAADFINAKGLAGSNLDHLMVSGNTFTGNKDAVSIWGGSTYITISDNALRDSLRYGISIKGQDIEIARNEITDNGDAGINIDRHVIDTERVKIFNNNITGNTNYGVQINTANVTEIVDATCNWWGAADGPSGQGPGSGDAVSQNADFAPWLLSSAPDGQCGFSINVQKYDDVDVDGEKDGSELGLEGWEFTLYNDQGQVGLPVTTGEDGQVSFDGLLPGVYTVCETLQDGWVNSDPGGDAPHCKMVSFGAGSVVVPGPLSTLLEAGDGNRYLIEFLGVSNNGFTWMYRVSEDAGKDLSNWILGLCDPAEVVSWTPTDTDDEIREVNIGLDPNTGIVGIKWNVTDGFESRIFAVTLSQKYPVGTTDVGIKTGGGDQTATDEIAGPHCGEGSPVEETLLFGNYQPGTFVINKEVVGEPPIEGDDWQFTINEELAFSIDNLGGTWQDDLMAGSYTIAETLKPGYATEVFCDVSEGAEILVDNSDPMGVEILGAWKESTVVKGYQGPNYIHDMNEGQGTKHVRFTPTLAEGGWYQVYLHWTSHPNRATNVPVDIVHAGGTDTVVVDQRGSAGGQMRLLGTYKFEAGTSESVVLRTAGADGYVIADAVRFVKLVEGAESVTVDLEEGQNVACTFLNQRLAQLWVKKYDDLDAGGTWNDGEPWLSGWEMSIYHSDDWMQAQPRQATDASGEVLFTDLAPGSYWVCEDPQPGWENTDPGAEGREFEGLMCQEVTVDYGDVKTVEFGNFRKGSLRIIKEATPEGKEAFTFGGDLDAFTLVDDGSAANQVTYPDLTPGLYEVTEAVTGKWSLLSVVCEVDGVEAAYELVSDTQDVLIGTAVTLMSGQDVVCTFTNEKPDAVELADVEAVAEGGAVTMRWRTLSEMETVGFNVMRSMTAEGLFEQVNGGLIVARGEGLGGASYEFVDQAVEAGVTYYYYVQEVLATGGVVDYPEWTVSSTVGGAKLGGVTYTVYLPLVQRE